MAIFEGVFEKNFRTRRYDYVNFLLINELSEPIGSLQILVSTNNIRMEIPYEYQ